MLVQQLLLETLEGLNDPDFNTFKWYLDLESPHRHHTVGKMIESLGEEMAVCTTDVILRMMKHINAAEKLKERHRGGAEFQETVSRPLVTSASDLGLPTGQKISDDGAAGAIVPRAKLTRNVTVMISGNICGNVDRILDGIAGGNGKVVISGNVDGNVDGILDKVASRNGKLIISGNVSGNVGGVVGGNLMVIISGHVGGDVGSNVGGDVGSNVGGNAQMIIRGNVSGKVGCVVRGNGGVIIRGNVGSNAGSEVCGNGDVNISGNVGSNADSNVGSNGKVVIRGNVGGNAGF